MVAQAVPAAPRRNRAARESRPAAVQGRRFSSPRTRCLLLTLAAWAIPRTVPSSHSLRPPPELAPDDSRSTARAWSFIRRRALAGEMDFSRQQKVASHLARHETSCQGAVLVHSVIAATFAPLAARSV